MDSYKLGVFVVRVAIALVGCYLIDDIKIVCVVLALIWCNNFDYKKEPVPQKQTEKEMKLSERLQRFRADRPDEWTMDEFIREAKELEECLTYILNNNKHLNIPFDMIVKKSI